MSRYPSRNTQRALVFESVSPMSPLSPFTPSSSTSSYSLGPHDATQRSSPSSAASPLPSTPGSTYEEATTKKRATARRSGPARSKNPIPRPPNCFILFRTDWCHRLEGQVERSHKQISRIAGKAWKRMSETQKVVWRERARIIKEEHKRCYPDYKFAPVQRKQKPKKRNVKHNSPAEMARCEQLAHLLAEGKDGDELELEVRKLDQTIHAEEKRLKEEEESRKGYSTGVFDPALWNARIQEDSATPTFESISRDVPGFRSPLLPPCGAIEEKSDPMAALSTQMPETWPDFEVPELAQLAPMKGAGSFKPVDVPQWHTPAMHVYPNAGPSSPFDHHAFDALPGMDLFALSSNVSASTSTGLTDKYANTTVGLDLNSWPFEMPATSPQSPGYQLAPASNITTGALGIAGPANISRIAVSAPVPGDHAFSEFAFQAPGNATTGLSQSADVSFGAGFDRLFFDLDYVPNWAAQSFGSFWP